MGLYYVCRHCYWSSLYNQPKGMLYLFVFDFVEASLSGICIILLKLLLSSNRHCSVLLAVETSQNDLYIIQLTHTVTRC